MQNPQQTIISQYASAPVMTALIESFNAAVDPSPSITLFFNNLWNVQTAQGYGLDVWGRIVGVTRILTVASGAYFGYTGPGTDGASGTPYNVAVYNPGASGTQNVVLSDKAFRTLIYAKAMANISNGSIPSINAILMVLFATGGTSADPLTQPAAYCTDDGGMQMTYTFSFPLTNVQIAIVETSGVLPRPSGVKLTYVVP
jgi:hypothetical protein